MRLCFLLCLLVVFIILNVVSVVSNTERSAEVCSRTEYDFLLFFLQYAIDIDVDVYFYI